MSTGKLLLQKAATFLSCLREWVVPPSLVLIPVRSTQFVRAVDATAAADRAAFRGFGSRFGQGERRNSPKMASVHGFGKEAAYPHS